MGAHDLERRAVRLATRTRVPLPESAAREGPLSRLTPREREVLDLLATGATNKTIATTLFITEKTASVHVSNLLGKLGVANRGAAAALARHLVGCVEVAVDLRSVHHGDTGIAGRERREVRLRDVLVHRSRASFCSSIGTAGISSIWLSTGSLPNTGGVGPGPLLQVGRLEHGGNQDEPVGQSEHHPEERTLMSVFGSARSRSSSAAVVGTAAGRSRRLQALDDGVLGVHR